MIYFYENDKLRILKVSDGKEAIELVNEQDNTKRILFGGGFKPTSAILTLVQ